jgi:hypothetical protein
MADNSLLNNALSLQSRHWRLKTGSNWDYHRFECLDQRALGRSIDVNHIPAGSLALKSFLASFMLSRTQQTNCIETQFLHSIDLISLTSSSLVTVWSLICSYSDLIQKMGLWIFQILGRSAWTETGPSQGLDIYSTETFKRQTGFESVTSVLERPRHVCDLDLAIGPLITEHLWIKFKVISGWCDATQFRNLSVIPSRSFSYSTIATGCGRTVQDYRFCSLQGQEISLFSIASRPALGPTQSPIQWAQGALYPGG